MKCENLCYLQCFDFKAGETIDGQETMKITLQNGTCFTSFVSCMAFSCCSDRMSSTEQKKALKLPQLTRSTSKSRTSKPNESESIIANEFKELKQTLQSIKNATKSNAFENAAFKTSSAQTESNELGGIFVL